jgi:PAS domain S-box-containing protein
MKTLRLLLLEDDTNDLALIRRTILAEWPDCELTCVDTEAGLHRALAETPWDAVLSDFCLTGFNGLQALEVTRKVLPKLPFLFVTGAIGEETAVDCLKAGATDYVLKDRLVKLVPSIRRALKEAEVCARREAAEAQLGQSEDQYRDLVNSVDGIVWQAELPELRFTFVSRQAERFLGYPVQSWLEEPGFWQNHIHPDDRERAVALCTQLTSDCQYRSFEYRMIAADGRFVWLRDIISLREQPGKPLQVQGIMVNITPRKVAERACHESQALKSVLMQAELDCVMVLDSEGRLIELNSAAEKTLGYWRSDVLGLPFLEMVLTRELLPRYSGAMLCYPEQSEWLGARHEVTAVRASGLKFPAELAIVAVPLGERHVFVSCLRDITQRKHTESRMRRVQAKLRQSNSDLKRRNREIENFYHTLSHELKTPLTSAREFICIVKDGLGGPLNPTQLDYLETARQSCDQLAACINDLLDATRLDTGKLVLDLKPASVAALVQKVAGALGPRAAAKGIRLSRDIQAGLPEVPLDQHRITQVVNNLLTNAIKYTPPAGHIQLRVAEDPQRPDLLRISVSDTGCGISEFEQERIFDRLYQVKSGDAATEQGVGLGLYLCRELVELHGGSIWVESALGQGSTFAFVLPKTQQALHSNLLIISDNPEVLQQLQSLLSAEQYNVRTAPDAPEALEQLQRWPPDVVMLDLAAPNLRGPANLKAIRRFWGEVPVILHTAFSDFDRMREALEFSPFTLLAKPCSTEQIVKTVRELQRSGDTARWEKTHERLRKPKANGLYPPAGSLENQQRN